MKMHHEDEKVTKTFHLSVHIICQ